MNIEYNYIKDGSEIYRRSFAIIRKEAQLARFNEDEEKVAVRIIHACGIVEAAADIFFSPDMVKIARNSLQNGAPILCDAKMVASGVTRARLPNNNEVICTLSEPRIPEIEKKIGRKAPGSLNFGRLGLLGCRFFENCGTERNMSLII